MNLPNVFGGIIRQLFRKILDGKVDAIAAYASVENEGEIRIDRMTGRKIMVIGNNLLEHMSKYAYEQGAQKHQICNEWFMVVPIYHKFPKDRLQQEPNVLGRTR